MGIVGPSCGEYLNEGSLGSPAMEERQPKRTCGGKGGGETVLTEHSSLSTGEITFYDKRDEFVETERG